MVLPDPSQTDFQVPDLSLPKSVTLERIQSRRELLKMVDHSFRKTEELAQYSNLDKFRIRR